MVRNITLIFTSIFCLGFLSKKETKGHNKIKFELIKKGMNKSQVENILGLALEIPNIENYVFYLSSDNVVKLIGNGTEQGKIFVVEYDEETVINKYLVEYKPYKSKIKQSAEPIIKKYKITDSI